MLWWWEVECTRKIRELRIENNRRLYSACIRLYLRHSLIINLYIFLACCFQFTTLFIETSCFSMNCIRGGKSEEIVYFFKIVVSVSMDS